MSSQMANAFSPQMEMAGLSGNWGLNDEYNYSSQACYEVTVVTELDGDVVAKKTVKPMQKELNKLDKRDSRYRGRI